MLEDTRIIYDPFIKKRCEFSEFANYYGQDSAEKMWEKQERLKSQPPPRRPVKESKVAINIGDDIGKYIRRKAGRPFPLDQKVEKKEFTDEDRRKFKEETDRILEKDWSRKTKDELIESSIETYSNIPMFDFGLGEQSNHQAIMDFYGYVLYKQIDKEIEASYECPSDERETGQLTQELWQLLRDIRAGRKSIPEATSDKKVTKPERNKPSCPLREKSVKTPSKIVTEKLKSKAKKPIKIQQRQRQPGDDYHLWTERGLIRNESYVELFKGPGVVYEVIWENVVRKGWHDTEAYPIRKIYHDSRKLLVYCTTWRHLAKQCKMAVNTVIGIVKKFEEARVVKTESFTPPGKVQEQTVFILGYWTGSGKSYREHLYRDEILLSPKVSKK